MVFSEVAYCKLLQIKQIIFKHFSFVCCDTLNSSIVVYNFCGGGVILKNRALATNSVGWLQTETLFNSCSNQEN